MTPRPKTLYACAYIVFSIASASAAEKADGIYFGGPIITVDDKRPSAEAVAVKDGRILAVGAREALLSAHKGKETALKNLRGKTLIPGLVDAHGHISMVGMQSMSANLLPPPDGPVNSIGALQKTLREFIAASPIVKSYRLVIGFDYDDSQLVERRHPTRDELDAVSRDLPIVAVHQSGHLGALNSKALEMAGVTADTKNPQGGVIRRRENSQEPNGVMEENAFFMTLLKLLPKLGPTEFATLVEAGQNTYARFGYTTAQDGLALGPTVHSFEDPKNRARLKIDVVAYPAMLMSGDDPILSGPLMSHDYTQHFRIGGVKVVLDGSPQGRTAWLTKPFYKAPEGKPEGYAGYGALTDEQLTALVTKVFQRDWQLLAHSNGDAATDQFLRAIAAASKVAPGADRRPVLVHGQVLREEQVDQIKALGVFPSLFPMHTYYWGDWYRESALGPERAENISPTGWFMQRGMIFSSHHDAPVTFPNSMRVLSATVNRTTRSGYVLGPQHRVDPLVALKAMTIWPAYQHFEETSKGSIEVGKLADFAILSDNPLAIAREKLADIKVLETIKEGRSVYKARAKEAAVSPVCGEQPECGRRFLAFRAAILPLQARSPLIAEFGAFPHFHASDPTK